MAAVLEENKHSESSDLEDDSQRRTVFGWIFDYCCYIFWEEFKVSFTVDAKSNRRLLEAIPMYAVDSNPSRQRLAHFVMLLTRLADGTDYQTEYNDVEEPRTPLEGAIQMLETLMDMMEENEEELTEDANNIITAIKAQAVLVCCRCDDYDTAVEVRDRLWVGQDLSETQQKIKARLDMALQTESLKRVPRDMSWKNFQRKSIEFLEQLYEQMATPFLYQAVKKFEVMKREKQVKKTRHRKKSGTSTEHSTDMEVVENTPRSRKKLSTTSGIEEKEDGEEVCGEGEGKNGSSTAHRVMPYRRLLATAKGLDNCDYEDNQCITNDVMAELKDVIANSNQRRTRQSSSQHPPSSPKQAPSPSSKKSSSPSKSRKSRSGKTVVVQFTPRKRTQVIRDSSDEEPTPKKTPNRRSSKPAVSPIVVDDDEDDDDEVEEMPDSLGKSVVTSTPCDLRDRPSTSTARTAREEDVNNKENNSPKRGKRIRDQRYQPGRVEASSSRTSNRNTNANANYIEWSSDDEGASPAKNNIFNVILESKKVRKSLDLEEIQIPYKIKKPTQRVPWTVDEEEKLRQGVEKYGKGNWAVIRDKYKFVVRTSVNLKDKWRNMEKDMLRK